MRTAIQKYASLGGAAMAICMLVMPQAAAQEEAFPRGTVTIVAPYPPGGTVDILARTLGQKISEKWGHPVIVENRPGASGIIGSQTVATARPDGHTLLVIPITHVTNASLYADLPFDPVADFSPIGLLATQPMLLVANDALDIETAEDLVALAKAEPGRLNCGSGGNGTSQHLACELFKAMADVDIQHIPYGGNAAAMTDVIGGQIEILFDQMATAAPHVRAASVKPVGVSALTRSQAFPDVPTIDESGLAGFETIAWFGLVGPADMPEELVTRINADFAEVLAMPEIVQELENLGLTLEEGSPEDFGSLIASDLDKWAEVVEASGASLD